MTHTEFNIPPQCRNCTFLDSRIKEYHEKSDDFANTALENGIREERVVLERGAVLSELKGSSAKTDQLLDVAAVIAASLREKLQKHMDFVGLYCNGTSNPESSTLQSCRSIQSVLE